MEPLPFENVEPVEMVAALFYHLAHLPMGSFWPQQIFRTRSELLYSVHLLRNVPEYEAWLQVAEMQMAELGLVPGKTAVSSVRPEGERILIVRPVPPSLENVATERDISSMGDVETWQKRYEKIAEEGITSPGEVVKLLENPFVESLNTLDKMVFTNRGKGPGSWVDPRPRKNNKYSWRKGQPPKKKPVIVVEEPNSSPELPTDTSKQES